MNSDTPNTVIPEQINGFYGQFGGSFVPEVIQKALDELEEVYKKIC